MYRSLRKFLHLSPASLFYAIAHPSVTLAKLSAPPPADIYSAVCFFFGQIEPGSVDAYRREFMGNPQFFQEINERLVQRRLYRTFFKGWRELLYLIVRFQRSKIVLETGVFDGHSSCAILQALSDNGQGKLISVDLPATKIIKDSTDSYWGTLPEGCQPGWIIPDYLRDRHLLILKDSKECLPHLLEEYPLNLCRKAETITVRPPQERHSPV